MKTLLILSLAGFVSAAAFGQINDAWIKPNNVTGPYQDIEATSPWLVSMTNPLQFFRLRQ